MNAISRQKIVIVYNPTAGGSNISTLKSVVQQLNAVGLAVELVETEYPGHASLLAEQIVQQDCDLIVAAGGDGTINEVLNGVFPSKIEVAIIPLGTVNVLAQELGLRNYADDIVKYLKFGQAQRCWLGCNNGQYFSLMMSVGNDAKSVATVNKQLKKYIGRLAYAVSFLGAVFKSKKITYKVTIDDKIYEASNVIVSNGKYYGGKYLCAPEADIRKPELYALLALDNGRMAALKYALLMLIQKYPFAASVKTFLVTKMKVECDTALEPVQMDGDHTGELPAEISISDDYINLLYPPEAL